MRINDVYWLFMPYNLKDSGLTLNYIAKNIPKYRNGVLSITNTTF